MDEEGTWIAAVDFQGYEGSRSSTQAVACQHKLPSLQSEDRPMMELKLRTMRASTYYGNLRGSSMNRKSTTQSLHISSQQPDYMHLQKLLHISCSTVKPIPQMNVDPNRTIVQAGCRHHL